MALTEAADLIAAMVQEVFSLSVSSGIKDHGINKDRSNSCNGSRRSSLCQFPLASKTMALTEAADLIAAMVQDVFSLSVSSGIKDHGINRSSRSNSCMVSLCQFPLASKTMALTEAADLIAAMVQEVFSLSVSSGIKDHGINRSRGSNSCNGSRGLLSVSFLWHQRPWH
ncbi:unnamed protein product [Acanthosepion pharaonis]|uniref:Uncharacterized protein n=1 Tax=Acanthosepion pharaonis TaxID=158019 RepID=A0A812CTL5_ACAPH|nr:unnamed protein product [Sepia pharaonis]